MNLLKKSSTNIRVGLQLSIKWWLQVETKILLPKPYTNDETLQKNLFKHTLDLENVQRNKKKDKGEVIGRQVSSN